MSQPVTVNALMEAFFQERESRPSLEPFVAQADAAGEHQLAKIFRAVIASDTYREKLMRQGLPHHATDDMDYYVCPHCGLIYEPEPPKHCVADETPAAEFEHIS